MSACPFHHLWASGKVADAADADVLDARDEDSAAPKQEPGPVDVSHSAGAARCPARHGATIASDQQQAAAADTVAPAAAAPSCPLGFGSSGGPKLGMLHCIICKSLLYDCVVTNCGHRYCAACVARFRDCPACGADITSLEADAEAQATVERFLEAHAGDLSIWELEGGTKPSAPSSSTSTSTGTALGSGGDDLTDGGRAAFLLQVGLRAVAGGNAASAAKRLGQCRDQLLADLADLAVNGSDKALSSSEGAASAGGTAPGTGTAAAGGSAAGTAGIASVEAREAAVRGRLGAVCGCLGDCARSAGDADVALERYEESAAYLRLAEATSAEAAQALSVTLNKIGEVHHLRGQVQEAAACYQESLDMRERLLRGLRPSAAGAACAQEAASATGAADTQKAASAAEQGQLLCSASECAALLDVAVGRVKLADALGTLGRGREGASLLTAADEALQEVESALEVERERGAVPAATQRKVAALRGYLERQQQQEGGGA